MNTTTMAARIPATIPTQKLDAMAMDKKATDGNVRLVLAEALGRVVVTDRVERDAIRSTLVKGETLCHG